MAKEGAKAIVPKVRFPEFEGNTHWTISKLGTRGRFLGGGTPSRENAEFWAGIHPWISSSDISDEEIRPVRPSRFITDEAVARSATQVVPAGSVLIVARVGVGKVAVSEEQLHTSQDFANLVPSSDSPAFLAYLLKSRKSALLAFNQGMAIKGFTRDDIAGLEVPIPDKPEQQKIADCLTSLDEVIAAQARIVEALKAHKRGLMQQLFPREGETRPRLRFPEFRDAPEWRSQPLGEVAEIKLGKMLDANKNKSGHLLPYVNNISLRWNEVDTSDLPQMYFKESELERFGLQKGDVLVCEGGEPGRSAVWDGRLPDLKFQKAVHRVRFHVPFVPKILVLYLEAIAGTNAFESLFTGGGIKHLTGETFAKLTIPVMPLPEQQRIADCLSSLDTRISAETARLAALKTHKQGLMQQLFPAPEAAQA